MIELPVVIDVKISGLSDFLDEVRKFRKILQHVVGWPLPPNPVQKPHTPRSGNEEDGMIQVFGTPVDIEGEGFSDNDKNEIVGWELTPTFDGVDQPDLAITGDKTDLAEKMILAPEGVTVTFKHKWVDNAGNKSTLTTESDPVQVIDATPPANPVGRPGIRVGDEVA